MALQSVDRVWGEERQMGEFQKLPDRQVYNRDNTRNLKYRVQGWGGVWGQLDKERSCLEVPSPLHSDECS